MMSNLNIFMRIINALIPNLPISYERWDYKNECYTSALTSRGNIELVHANQHSIALFLFLIPFFLIEMRSVNQGVINSPDEYDSQ
jgi:hypothetical protein